MSFAYAKLQALNGEDHYITELPFNIGSGPKPLFNCSKLQEKHCTISFSHNQFMLKAHAPTTVVNSGLFSNEDPPIQLKDLSCICFHCDRHQPHIYYFVLPFMNGYVNEPPGKAPIPENEEAIPIDTFPSRQADTSMMKKWGVNDRENLKKWLLTFGYGRWKKLREVMSEGGAYTTKPIPEIRSFATALVRTVGENLPLEKHELKKNLTKMIQETEEDFYIPPRIKDWGQMVRQRAVPWAKRLDMLWRIKDLIRKFKKQYQTDPKWGNLLNFMSSSAFYGQRPSSWWTRRHDVDLIRGTYKHGYANYTAMRSDPQLSFSQVDTDGTFKEFPSADTITRRLKKLMIAIEKVEEYDFEQEQQFFESTDWNSNEKLVLLKLITEYGVPLNLEGKNDWNLMKEKMDGLVPGNDKGANSIERMVQHLRMLAQHTIHPEEDQEDVKDADGFSMSIEQAENLQNNFNKLQFVRKHILKNGSELFNNELASLLKATEKLKSESEEPKPWLSEEWKCEVHDRGLLNALADNGLEHVRCISDNPEYGFSGMQISPELVNERIQYLCEFFRTITNLQKYSKKKRPPEELTFDEKGQIRPVMPAKKTKTSNFVVPRDEEGNVEFPLMINNSLTILNLGEIETERPAYHSGRNIFPIGFKSIREHTSMFNPKERMQYLCEILDGGPKPLFKVTPMKEKEPIENQAILKDSCTGCWIVICNKVNELQRSRRSKVTVSGTDRFGLWDPNVVKLIHELPGAEKLINPNT